MDFEGDMHIASGLLVNRGIGDEAPFNQSLNTGRASDDYTCSPTSKYQFSEEPKMFKSIF